MAETNLHRGVSEPAVRDLAQRAAVVLVHCAVAREVSLRRFQRRYERGERHACFEDGQRLADLQERGVDESWERARPLEVDLPVLVVDTTDGYNPTLSEIVRFVGTTTRRPSAGPALDGGAFYDQPGVFDAYWRHRSGPTSPNELIEEPIILDLLGSVDGLRVLDLGCGDAAFGRSLLAAGAASYVGVDSSERMVELARTRLRGTPGHVVHGCIEEVRSAPASVDVVVSRLALHYVEDLEGILAGVHAVLRPAGRLVFSAEHPVITSCDRGSDQSRPRGSWLVDDYFVEGRRETAWLGGHVVKYHRSLEDYLRLLERTGFRVDAVREGGPERSRFADGAEFHRRSRIPLFLVVRATRLP